MKWHWLWFPFVVAIAAVAYFIGGRKGTLKKTIALERKVIEGRAKAKRHLANDDAETAVRRIEKDHAEEITQLAEEDRNEIERLRNDPAAYIEYILRASS